MKKIALSVSAAALVLVAGMAMSAPASAGVIINANVDLTAVEQVSSNVDQSLVSVGLAYGPTLNSSLSASGVNALQIATIDKTLSTDESAWSNGGAGNYSETEVTQSLKNLDQTGLVLAATGPLVNSALTASMANVAQDASVSVTITTKH